MKKGTKRTTRQQPKEKSNAPKQQRQKSNSTTRTKPQVKIRLSDDQKVLLEELKASLEHQLEAAIHSGHYLICIFHRNGKNVELWRRTERFPISDFATVVDMLDSNLRKERAILSTPSTAPAK